MGKFANSVRRSQRSGPNQRGFKRTEWESLLKDISLDLDDKRLLYAGLFFDELLRFLRKEMQLSDLALRPNAIARFVIAIATSNLFRISEQTKISPPIDNEQPTLFLSTIMEKTVQVPTRQHFSPDELITGAGDGMKYMLRELLAATADPDKGKGNEYEADSGVVNQISAEFNKAIIYHCAVEFWFDCVGNGYGLTKHEQGIALKPYDSALEIARIASNYRRRSIAFYDLMEITESWIDPLPRAKKVKLCRIHLVSRIYGVERIEQIELGINSKVLNTASMAVAATLWLQHSYYRLLLDEPLPKFADLTLNQIILGWRLLQSLAVAILDSMNSTKEGDVRDLLRFAPRISRRVLHGTFCRALSLDKERVSQLINVFVFNTSCSQEVWLQPLISIEDDYCLVVPCIYSVHLQRVVEGWMRQGGLDLARRGPEFEQFCREDLTAFMKESPIKQSIVVLKQSVRFKPVIEREEEIDIVIFVADTVLLVEAKCILWPDDSLQFANYRDTVEKAVTQIVRKRDAVRRNYSSFRDRLKQLGYDAPTECNVICCVLTNSAVYAGFPIDDVPIVDLSILGSFFQNKHVKVESKTGKLVQRHVINFYIDAASAGRTLERYLFDPPQLSDLRLNVKKREVIFPIESKFGKLVQETYAVEINIEEMLKRYELSDVTD